MASGKRLTTQDFIEQAKAIHGDKYDYSNVQYKNMHSKVQIVCPIHGAFEQLAMSHISTKKKSGCSQCSGKAQSNTEQFIQKAKTIHGDKYDYSKVNYTTTHNKVIIICKIHGEFEQTPKSHISQKSGCIKCKLQQAGRRRALTTEQFIQKAKTIHGDKYDYSSVQYFNNNTKVIINCPLHGQYEQTPDGHVNQCQGCPQCGKIRDAYHTGGYSEEKFRLYPEIKTTPGILYIVCVEYDGEKFLKIGITTRTSKQRFDTIPRMKHITWGEYQLPIYEAFLIEQQVLSQLKQYRFYPNNKFSGYTECFKMNVDVLYQIQAIVEQHKNNFNS